MIIAAKYLVMSFIRWRKSEATSILLLCPHLLAKNREASGPRFSEREWLDYAELPAAAFSVDGGLTRALREKKCPKKQFLRAVGLWIILVFDIAFCADLCYEVYRYGRSRKKAFFSIAELGAYAMKRRRSQDEKPLAFRKSRDASFSILCLHLWWLRQEAAVHRLHLCMRLITKF